MRSFDFFSEIDKQPFGRKVLWLCFIFIVIRGLAMLCLWAVFRGNEPTSDIDYYLEIGLSPVTHFLGQTEITPYPPLQGFLMWPMASAAAPLPAFAWSFRVVFTLVELAVYLLVLRVVAAEHLSFFRLAVLTVLPLPFLATSIWAQEEVIAGAFVLVGILLWDAKRSNAAIGIWSLGIIVGKIYVLPLLVLGLAVAVRMKQGAAVVIAAGVLALGYGGRLLGGRTGFEGFVPQNDYYFTNTFWSMPVIADNIALRTQFLISVALCAVWGGLCVAYWAFRRPQAGIGVMYAITMLGIYMLFFHVNPEYFLLPYFALLACFMSREISWRQLLSSGVLLSFAWLHNLAYVACVSKKLLHCAAWIFPYGSLLLGNIAVAVALAALVAYVLRTGTLESQLDGGRLPVSTPLGERR